MIHGSQHIAVIGEMGVGKTTVGALLADSLGRDFADSDVVLERAGRGNGAEIAASEGVPMLHRAEMEAFCAMLALEPAAVIAPAASVVDTAVGRLLFDGVFVVWLTAPDHILAVRQALGDHRRSVSSDQRAKLQDRRRPHLGRLADLVVDTAEASPEEIVSRIRAVTGE